MAEQLNGLPGHQPRPELRVISVEDLLYEARAGRLVLRQTFDWRRRDVIDLLDSMFKGYPIGNLILWERPAESLTGDVWHVIDGQHRLCAITNALALNPAPPFDVVFDLDSERFVQASEGSDSCLPLHLTLSSSALVDHLRELPQARRRKHVDAANRVAQGLQDYRLPVTIVRGDSAQVEDMTTANLKKVTLPARTRDRLQLLATLRDLKDYADAIHTGAHVEAGHCSGPWRSAFDKLAREQAARLTELITHMAKEGEIEK